MDRRTKIVVADEKLTQLVNPRPRRKKTPLMLKVTPVTQQLPGVRPYLMLLKTRLNLK